MTPTPPAPACEHYLPVLDTARARFKLWGVRGSIPTPGPGTVFYGGNTTCVEVRADGQLLTCEPAAVLPMAQRYFLF